MARENTAHMCPFVGLFLISALSYPEDSTERGNFSRLLEHEECGLFLNGGSTISLL